MLARMEYCIECRANTMHHNANCCICTERKARIKRAEWLALTSEEKIEQLVRRIERLEQSPPRY